MFNSLQRLKNAHEEQKRKPIIILDSKVALIKAQLEADKGDVLFFDELGSVDNITKKKVYWKYVDNKYFEEQKKSKDSDIRVINFMPNTPDEIVRETLKKEIDNIIKEMRK